MHSIVVASLAICIALAFWAGVMFSMPLQVTVLAFAVAGIGLPHGGFDHWTGRRLVERGIFRNMSTFLAAYLAVLSLVVIGWYAAPLFTLLAFFALSAWHFGLEEEDERTSSLQPLEWLGMVARGGMVIWVPAVFQASAVERLLLAIIPDGSVATAQAAVICLRTLAPLLGVLTIFDVWTHWNRPQRTGTSSSSLRWTALLRIACFGLLFATAPPLISFGVYFCGWHSIRGLLHLRRRVWTFDTAIREKPASHYLFGDPPDGSWISVLASPAHTDRRGPANDVHRFECIGGAPLAPAHFGRRAIRNFIVAPAKRLGGPHMSVSSYDYILVGGGLQAGLLILAIRYHQPRSTVLLIEKDAQLAGNHTWSFHATDIPAAARLWCADLPATYWDGYSVIFPDYQRHVELKYASMASRDFARIVRECEEVDAFRRHLTIMNGQTVTTITPQHVVTESGQQIEGTVVIDCRGPTHVPCASTSAAGFQKFHGIEVEIGQDWPRDIPDLMDSRLCQNDGFRFRYILPFSRRRILVEDTCFSDNRRLDAAECRRQSEGYLRQQGIRDWTILRQESGCLPMPYGDHEGPQATLPLRGGYAGGWFHAATGYSFSLAVRFAEAVANVLPEEASASVQQLKASHEFQSQFARFLNRMLFRMVRPETRWQLFRRFYRVLSEEAIARFYAHEFTRADAAKLVIGLPPAGLTPFRFLKSYEAMSCPAAS